MGLGARRPWIFCFVKGENLCMTTEEIRTQKSSTYFLTHVHPPKKKIGLRYCSLMFRKILTSLSLPLFISLGGHQLNHEKKKVRDIVVHCFVKSNKPFSASLFSFSSSHKPRHLQASYVFGFRKGKMVVSLPLSCHSLPLPLDKIKHEPRRQQATYVVFRKGDMVLECSKYRLTTPPDRETRARGRKRCCARLCVLSPQSPVCLSW